MTWRDVKGLAELGLVPPGDVDQLDQVAKRYSVAVTPTIASLVDENDPQDPIARQFVPDRRELKTAPDELLDPIGDTPHSACNGLVHRYPDRVLLKLATTCAVYCRFCFRRESVGSQAAPMSREAITNALVYIMAHPEIWEVILSGGDPLTISARRLRAVTERLADIGHVRILRVHTRLPVVAPDRVETELIEALRASGKTVYVAVHANHPRELSEAARRACAQLADAGLCLVSQSVLLRGVNDNVETLVDLMRAFVESRIKPYYLHHPDLAPGTAHFRLSVEQGQSLVRQLLGRISGLCRPHYMLDIPGGYGKSPIGPTYLDFDRTGTTRVTDFQGRTHLYNPSS